MNHVNEHYEEYEEQYDDIRKQQIPRWDCMWCPAVDSPVKPIYS